MNSTRYIVLLNSAIKNHLLTQSTSEKRRLREKIEFLENGLWDTGVRVKKLKGVSNKVVFEARLTKSDRIIFTLGTHSDKTAIYLWGIAGHDDINATAQRIYPLNAPFLDFESEAHEEFPEISIDELPAEYFTTEDIQEKAPQDYGPQKWLILNDEQWKRIILGSDPEAFEIFLFLTTEQQKVLNQEPPVLLAGTAGSGKTTIAVYYLLRREFMGKRRLFLTYSPYLKRFSEQIYDGLVAHADIKGSYTRPDFYIFRDLLRDIVEAHGRRYDRQKEVGLREFEHIFRTHRLFKKYDTELVWEEIRSIIKGAKPPIFFHRYKRLIAQYIADEITRNGLYELKDYLVGLRNLEIIEKIDKLVTNKARYATYDEFLLELESGKDASKDRIAFVLNEILTIVEKRATTFAEPLLTFQEYMILGKKRAPAFLYDRQDIYSIAEFYQGRLEAQGLWDEIDLCKSAVQGLTPSDGRFVYDLVVCDEVQDFSDIQLSLIFRLAGSCRNVFLTGDLKQIINPSGFRWEEVKNKFYERGVPVPDVLKLNLNFRCVGNIVKLSNALLDLKQRLIGLSDTELREDWKFNGKPPFLIAGLQEKDIIERVKITGAGQIILVRDRLEQERLKHALRTELIFTINEAKGLEFDTVFLWKFSKDPASADLWRKIQNSHSYDQSHYPHVKHELNLLYVAITRARNTLIIYDGEIPSHVWDLDAFQDKLYRTSEKELLFEMWQRISSPEEWERQGDYFFEREYYPAAAECYKNAGNLTKTEVAEAFVLEGKRRYAEAAHLFEKNHYDAKAAENYEKSGDYERAVNLWQIAGDHERSHICRIRMYEIQGHYNKAAEEWEKLKHYENALVNWEKANNHIRIAHYYLSLKQHKKAAERFEQAKEYRAAATCYRKARNYERAADLYFQAKDFNDAVLLYRKLKRTEALLECYTALKDYYSAALLYERAKDIDRAIETFKKFAGLSQENRDLLFQEAEKYAARKVTLKSALRYSALSMYEISAPFYLQKKFYVRAITEYRILGNHPRLAECYSKQEKFYEAALEMEQADAPEKWEVVTNLLRQHVYGKESGRGGYYGTRDKKRWDNLFREAESLVHSGSYEKALVRSKAIYDGSGVYQAFLRLGRDEEALRFFIENDLAECVTDYCKGRKELIISRAFLKELVKKFCYTYVWYDKRSKPYLDLIVQQLSAE